jgi:hypothetical protein
MDDVFVLGEIQNHCCSGNMTSPRRHSLVNEHHADVMNPQIRRIRIHVQIEIFILLISERPGLDVCQ